MRRQPDAYLVVGVSALTSALLFLALHAPIHTEYKFLALTGVALGLIAGVPMAALFRRSGIAGLLVLWCFLLPLASNLVRIATRTLSHPSGIRAEGRTLVHPDPLEDALHRWLRAHTEADAVFVDSELTLPSFASRRLFVAVDPGADWIPQKSTLRGWNMRPSAPYRTARTIGHRVAARRRCST